MRQRHGAFDAGGNKSKFFCEDEGFELCVVGNDDIGPVDSRKQGRQFFWAVVVHPSVFIARVLEVSVTLKTIEELLIIFLVEDPYRGPQNSFLEYRQAGRLRGKYIE